MQALTVFKESNDVEAWW